MERLGIFFLGLFSLVILAESTSVGLSTTTEASRSNGCDARNVIEKPRADLLKSKGPKDDPECSLANQSNVKGTVQIGEQSARGLHLNKISDAFTIPAVSFSNNYTKDAKGIENREDDASNHKDGSDVDLSSHNAPLDSHPDLISARPTRQVEESNADYSNPSSVENISAESDDESENIGSSQESSDLEGDLGVAEDRYRYQYPYWYRRPFANQRYRTNERREPYRNYLRYPVFPGK